MNDRTFSTVTFIAGAVMLAASVVTVARDVPSRVECEEDEVVVTSNGVDHDTCENAEEFVIKFLKNR